MKNIVLIGFMGSGKTSMGRFLSRELDYDFLIRIKKWKM